MKRFFKVYLFILTVFLSVILIIVGPQIYSALFIKQGKPISTDILLPSETTQARFALDGLELFNTQDIYNLTGWDFPVIDPNVSASNYYRLIVLYSGSKNYVFHADTSQRIDIQTRFSGLGYDVTMSGLSALIYKGAINPGTYGLGIIFKNDANHSSYFLNLNKCITRTPNRIWLEDLTSFACRIVTFNFGNPVINVNLDNIETIKGKYNFENLKLSDQKGTYILTGWSFPQIENETLGSGYTTEVILFREDGNYVFKANSATRVDIQDLYSNLGMDLSESGFSSVITTKALDQGALWF